MIEEYVVLVDEDDNEIGVEEKLAAHQKGLLHRAFSVFITNAKGEILLQQRADDKYHSAGLWTNACCSHPRPDEDINSAVQRRLFEEMGITAETEFVLKFLYRTPFENGLIEHEMDYVFIGKWEGIPEFNTNEVKAIRWLSIPYIQQEIKQNPESYTYWFRDVFERVIPFLKASSVLRTPSPKEKEKKREGQVSDKETSELKVLSFGEDLGEAKTNN